MDQTSKHRLEVYVTIAKHLTFQIWEHKFDSLWMWLSVRGSVDKAMLVDSYTGIEVVELERI